MLMPRIALGIVIAVTAALGIDDRTVTIPAGDDLDLVARIYPAATEGPGVLLLHQCDREGPLTGYESLAAHLQARGVHVLMLDFRGYGESRDDHFTGENWQEAQRHFVDDVEHAYSALVSQEGVNPDRIAIVGASCGGRFGIQLAKTHEGVQALAFMSCGLGRNVSDLMEGVRERPVFCVAAEDDPFGRAAASLREAFAASTHPDSRLIIYKGTAHGTPLFDQDPTLVTTMTDWLVARLTPPPPP